MAEQEIGFCKCGCGKKTNILKCNNKKRGHVKGQPANFITGHSQKSKIKKCSVQGCERRNHAKGLCRLHYMRKWHTGEIFENDPPKTKKNITGERFGRWHVVREVEGDGRGSSIWECICDCGTIRNVRGSALWGGLTKSCGCLSVDLMKSKKGEKANGWKGGRRKCNGYILIHKPEHPNADLAGYVAEHRLIMSEHIGRKLEDYELVHHKNGIRSDNRLENLALLTYSNHHGEIECPYCKGKFLLK
jgi:hypothetical protein